MAVGAFLEPLVVIGLLTFGTIVNRRRTPSPPSPRLSSGRWEQWDYVKPALAADHHDVERGRGSDESTFRPSTSSRSSSSSSSSNSSNTMAKEEARRTGSTVSAWRQRRLRFLCWETDVTSPNTEVFRHRLLSRVLYRFPFFVEVWYWALIYWVYQLGRAFTAVTLQDSTVDTARAHALQVIHLEQRLGLFVEPAVQRWFLQFPQLMRWTNRVYSFIHIPGTILFLIVLYHATTAKAARHAGKQVTTLSLQEGEEKFNGGGEGGGGVVEQWSREENASLSSFGPAVYARRRRTMAVCNLLAFVVFTLWPCMPPRLLSDPAYAGEHAAEAKGYGFVDTVHGADGDSSVWTTNRFCNQYAAMPSLHFGYSFLIGLTIATVPLGRMGRFGWRRVAMVCIGMVYPAIILAAIVATANHFILDAVAGAAACVAAWNLNGVLLNLLPLEDYFLAMLRMHKP